jgi:hypothetical protein
VNGGWLLRNAIVGMSFFTSGVMAYLVPLRLARWWRGGRHADSDLANALLDTGLPLVVVPVALLLLKVRSVSFTWQTIMYATGLVLCALGAIGIAVNVRKERRARR